ncbi:MAG: hemerythrin family protein [Gammaproteobacteria bacterium]|nr:hemerythrin family protein [Gammaproteobacteria bacterium]MCP5458522.1 hemerythrin family protein [Gammaproteobacteria bacterium]
MKPFIEWSDSLSVGVQQIDEQHKELVSMVNKVNEGISGGWGKEARDEILTRLVEYTRIHFATEESLMDISKYPEQKSHKHRHDDLINMVGQHLKKYEEDPNASNYDLLFFLKKWLVDHIMKDDKKLGAYLVKKGLSTGTEHMSFFTKIKKMFGMAA